MVRIIFILTVASLSLRCSQVEPTSLKVGVFSFNATPPLGSPVAYAMTRSIQDSLMGKGIVILSREKPVVVCAVDWLGIANEGLERWRYAMAKAAGTSIDRVSIHAVHQHDGARGDFTTASILNEHGLGGWRYDTAFISGTIQKSVDALGKAIDQAHEATHMGYGQAKVHQVASNRRILGSDGKVEIIRWSRSNDSAAIAAPEGLIDPWLKSVSFWSGDTPIVNLCYYTTHPMSHYGKGDVSADFVGIARESFQQESGVPQVYFSGAGGNITAGKYNDGSVGRRYILADRVKNAMIQAWNNTIKIPVNGADVSWRSVKVKLPLASHLVEEELIAQLQSNETDSLQKFTAAKHLAWWYRSRDNHPVFVSALNIKNVWLLNLPGELFVEYQLAAQKIRPQDFICTAAYEEYGPGYIGTQIAYGQGGYEDSERASRVAPEVEGVLMEGIREVLQNRDN